MSTRTLTNTVNPDIIALNAAIFGYAGHSVLTPHAAIQQIWWTEARIAEKVTPEFVKSKLRPEARANLNFAIGFGDGLTDDTYMEWILSRAKRLFLILVECAVPEQIFGIVDDSWDDDDLPISLEDVSRLAQRDYRLGKFHTVQFQFLLRQLKEGSHIDYAPNEVVPLDYIQRLPPAAALQRWSRVHMPKAPERIYVRRKMSLDENDETRPTKGQFLADVETAQSIKNGHIAQVYATYTAKNAAYFLTPFVAEHTLKSFIDFRTPASMQKMGKAQRCAILLQWLHCLADAVCCIHSNGLCHSAITPSNILVDVDNKIAFSDIGSLKSVQTDKRTDPNEGYNYSAPEAHTSLHEDEDENEILAPLKPKSRFFHRRKKSNESKATSSSSNSSSSRGQSYVGRESYLSSRTSIDSQATYLPSRTNTHATTASSLRSSTMTRVSSTSAESHKSIPPRTPSASAQSWSATSDTSSSLSSIVSLYASNTTTALPRSLAPPAISEKADIFSLGCIYIDILTFALSPKHSSTFAKLRSTKLARSTRAQKGFRSTRSMRPVGKVDSSFHANLAKVGEWLEAIEREAFDREEPPFRSYPRLLSLVRAMVQVNPSLRPAAAAVKGILGQQHAQGEISCGCAEGGATKVSRPPVPSKDKVRKKGGGENTEKEKGDEAWPIGTPSVPGRAGRTAEAVAPSPGVPLAAGRSGVETLQGKMGGLSVEETVGYAGTKRGWRRGAVGVS